MPLAPALPLLPSSPSQGWLVPAFPTPAAVSVRTWRYYTPLFLCSAGRTSQLVEGSAARSELLWQRGRLLPSPGVPECCLGVSRGR